MPINYIPSDPASQDAAPMYQKAPRPDRAATVAHFACAGAVPEGLYAEGTPGFLYWQCREAALATLDLWDLLNDAPLASWGGGKKTLEIRPNDGVSINAFYDRQRTRASFYRYNTARGDVFFGASTDIVAHEIGHALLDTVQRRSRREIRPLESEAFHEAFGDCVAFLAGIADDTVRAAVFCRSPDLGSDNFLEAWGESLAACYREAREPTDPATVPRRLKNSLRWTDPVNLPGIGPPGGLSKQFHIFGQVFSGCFYDTVRNIFVAGPGRGQADLLRAGLVAGRLLLAGLRTLTGAESRFFRAVGASMVAADRGLYGGANATAIRQAFEAHGLTIEVDLLGASPALASRREVVAPRRREISLGQLDRRLADVVVAFTDASPDGAPESSLRLLGGGRGADPVQREVSASVEVLLENDLIAFGPVSRAPRQTRARTAETAPRPTHAVRVVKGRRTLVQIGYACQTSARPRR